MAEEERETLGKLEADQFRRHHFGLNNGDAWLLRLLAVALFAPLGHALAGFLRQSLPPGAAKFMAGSWDAAAAFFVLAALGWWMSGLWLGRRDGWSGLLAGLAGGVGFFAYGRHAAPGQDFALWWVPTALLVLAAAFLFALRRYFTRLPVSGSKWLRGWRIGACLLFLLALLGEGISLTVPSLLTGNPKPASGETGDGSSEGPAPTASPRSSATPAASAAPTATPATPTPPPTLTAQGNSNLANFFDGLPAGKDNKGAPVPPPTPPPAAKQDPGFITAANSGNNRNLLLAILHLILTGGWGFDGGADNSAGNISREALAAMLRRANADGSLTQAEIDQVFNEIGAAGKLPPAQAESLRQFLHEQLAQSKPAPVVTVPPTAATAAPSPSPAH